MKRKDSWRALLNAKPPVVISWNDTERGRASASKTMARLNRTFQECRINGCTFTCRGAGTLATHRKKHHPEAK